MTQRFIKVGVKAKEMVAIKEATELGQNAEGWGDHQEEDPEDDHGAGRGVHHLRAVGSVAVGPPKRSPGQLVEEAQEIGTLLAESPLIGEHVLDDCKAVSRPGAGEVNADDLPHVGGQEHDV